MHFFAISPMFYIGMDTLSPAPTFPFDKVYFFGGKNTHTLKPATAPPLGEVTKVTSPKILSTL